jgi:glycosyltransferase involved in cell wall biosynthesis
VLHCEWRSTRDRACRRSFHVGTRIQEPTGPDDPASAEALQTVLDVWSPDVVHVQNLIGHSIAAFEVLRSFPGTVVCSIHDLYLACPNHSLLYRDEAPCGIPDDLDVCARCLPETRGLGLDELQRFRDTVRRGADVVDHWVVASRSAGDYLLRAYDLPEDRIEVIPHGSVTPPVERPPLDRTHLEHAPLQVGFVGRGWRKKGLDIVNELVKRLDGAPVVVHHFGEPKDPVADGVVVHGPYDNRRLPGLLHRLGIHVVLLPGPYAETFGFVLTEALLAGVPVIGPPYGAIAERIRELQVGWTVDPDDLDGLVELVTNLDHCRDELARAAERARDVPVADVAATAGSYATLYRAKVAV